MPQSPERQQLEDGELGEISQNPTKWPSYFSDEQVRRLERVSGEMLASLDYQVETTAGNADPGPLKRAYWRATDFVRLTRFRRKTNQNFSSLSKVARNLAFSYKSYRTKRH